MNIAVSLFRIPNLSVNSHCNGQIAFVVDKQEDERLVKANRFVRFDYAAFFRLAFFFCVNARAAELELRLNFVHLAQRRRGCVAQRRQALLAFKQRGKSARFYRARQRLCSAVSLNGKFGDNSGSLFCDVKAAEQSAEFIIVKALYIFVKAFAAFWSRKHQFKRIIGGVFNDSNRPFRFERALV